MVKVAIKRPSIMLLAHVMQQLQDATPLRSVYWKNKVVSPTKPTLEMDIIDPKRMTFLP